MDKMNTLNSSPINWSRREFVQKSSLAVIGMQVGLASGIPCQDNTNSYVISEHIKPLKLSWLGTHKALEDYLRILQKMPQVVLIDPQDALFSQAEAVIIAVPLRQRAELAKRALLAGCHVLIDTPMACSYEEFDEIQGVAIQQDKRIAIASFHRFLKSAYYAREIIFKQEIGEVTSIQIQVYSETTAPLLSGSQEGYVGKGLPLFDLVRWMCAKTPFTLTAAPENRAATVYKPQKVLYLLVNFNRIPLAYMTTTLISPEIPGGWLITIYGQKGILQLTANGDLQRLGETGRWEQLVRGEAIHYQIAMQCLLQDFIASCHSGKEPEVNSLDGMAGVALTLATVDSAKTGKTIQMIEM